MDKFWELLEKSTIVSGLVAVMVMGTICYLTATGQEVPELLGTLGLAILAFFFGAKSSDAGYRALNTRREEFYGRE